MFSTFDVGIPGIVTQSAQTTVEVHVANLIFKTTIIAVSYVNVNKFQGESYFYHFENVAQTFSLRLAAALSAHTSRIFKTLE